MHVSTLSGLYLNWVDEEKSNVNMHTETNKDYRGELERRENKVYVGNGGSSRFSGRNEKLISWLFNGLSWKDKKD